MPKCWHEICALQSTRSTLALLMSSMKMGSSIRSFTCRTITPESPSIESLPMQSGRPIATMILSSSEAYSPAKKLAHYLRIGLIWREMGNQSHLELIQLPLQRAVHQEQKSLKLWLVPCLYRFQRKRKKGHQRSRS